MADLSPVFGERSVVVSLVLLTMILLLLRCSSHLSMLSVVSSTFFYSL